MKILTPQEEADHNKYVATPIAESTSFQVLKKGMLLMLFDRAVWEGGLLGGAGGFGLGAGSVWLASKRSAGFRSLSLPFRAFLVTSSATFVAVISADRASRGFERARHADSDYKNKTEREEAEMSRDIPLWQRTKTFVSEQRYPIVFGSWVASMGIAMGLVSRNRWLTGQQKLVQARVYAQGLTLAVLVASFALEGNDMRAGKGRWETIKILDPSGSGKMVEKRIHHEAYSGEDQWMDMIESQEEKMRKRGHMISVKEEKTKVEEAAKKRKEPIKKSKGTKEVEEKSEDAANTDEEQRK